MVNKYYPTIGLEIHAELKTLTKMFCGCKNPAGKPSVSNGAGDPEIAPNTLICPVCMAHPGALPVINKKAIEHVIKVGLAIGGNIADFTEFDRKNYFYPDIPKGYQISQYKYPIVFGGHLVNFDVTRVHLEEDTANNKHDRGDFSLIDFNRAGVPLMELVTEPHTFENAEDTSKAAVKFAKEFQLVLWYLGVSEANMEKGEMRVEANVSISTDKKKLGTKVEVKNLNSFRSVERAIKYEIDRMIELMEGGKRVEIVQETRGWDDGKQKTFSQRKKEGSADYRYFPDPDLPKLKLHEAFDLEKMKRELPELPEAKRVALRNKNFKEEDIEILINNPDLATNIEETSQELSRDKVNPTLNINVVSNLGISSVIGIKKEDPEARYPEPKEFAQLSEIVISGGINSTSAKIVIRELMTTNKTTKEIIEEKNLAQESNEERLKQIAQKVIDTNPKVVADYKGGKENALMSLVGQIMKETKGSANPQVVKQILIDLLARP